jgi:hypothetical protein
MADYRDFKEIAHSGGKITFSVERDAEGGLSISTAWSHGNPTPAAIAGLYADLNSGLIVGDFRLGGMGEPFKPPPPGGAVPVFIGSDSHAKWGHMCPRCRGYFRSEHHPAIHPLTCAYCGWKGPTHAFRTRAQRKYVHHVIEKVAICIQELPVGEHRDVVIDMDVAGDESVDPKPEFYYTEQAQQTEFNCEKCGGYNDVRGRYAYCGACGWRNNRESFESQIEGTRERLNARTLSPESAVRDAVSAFDACCRDFAKQVSERIPMKPTRRSALERPFYDTDGVAMTAMKQADIDLTRGLGAEDAALVRLMMHRRHVHEHLGGVADATYVTESGDTAAKAGDLLREDQGQVHRFANLLVKMVANVEVDFHEIFPPTDWPIEYYKKGGDRGGRRIW